MFPVFHVCRIGSATVSLTGRQPLTNLFTNAGFWYLLFKSKGWDVKYFKNLHFCKCKVPEIKKARLALVEISFIAVFNQYWQFEQIKKMKCKIK
jgi:hypothetical protein